MAISPLSGAGPAGISGTGSPQKLGEDFGQVMKAQTTAQPGKCKVEGARQAHPEKQVTAAKVLDQVNSAQNRMEQILKMAESGKSFSPAELLSLQTHVYRASQELDLAGKVVEKATGGVKQVLQTQV